MSGFITSSQGENSHYSLYYGEENLPLKEESDNFLKQKQSSSFTDISILTIESNDFELKAMVAPLIQLDKPVLNKAVTSISLQLFS